MLDDERLAKSNADFDSVLRRAVLAIDAKSFNPEIL